MWPICNASRRLPARACYRLGYSDALAPTNFLWSNPTALKATLTGILKVAF